MTKQVVMPPVPHTVHGPPPAAPAGSATVAAGSLPVAVGQALAARVIDVAPGQARLAIAGGRLAAATDLPLRAGESLRMVVTDVSGGRVVLTPAAGPGGDAGRAALAASALVEGLRQGGMPARAAAALAAALAQAGIVARPADAPQLAARAIASGVGTPAQAAAFARLTAAALPTHPAAVAGLADLLDGAPLGRALAAIVDAARSAGPRAGTPGGGAAPGPGAPMPAATAVGGAALTAPAVAVGAQVPAATPAPTGHASSAPPPPTAAAMTVAVPAAGTDVRALGDLLGRMLQGIADDAVSGDGAALRRAVAGLGTGIETRLPGASAGPEPSVRALLTALAAAPAAEPALARAAASLADTLGAQSLAGQAGGSPPGMPAAPPGGLYLQLPLPGGASAQVRVDPDEAGGGTGERTTRRVALLLDLSALGRVMITATAGDGPVDARVRAEREDARAFLATYSGDLVAALSQGDNPARVRVEAVARPAPERLLAPPPALGVDRHA